MAQNRPILGHSGTPYFEALSAQYEEKGGFWAILGQNGPKRGPKYGPKWVILGHSGTPYFEALSGGP